MTIGNHDIKRRAAFVNELKLVLRTSRPSTAFMAGLIMFMILLRESDFTILQDIITSLPIVLATMTGFILNDIYDFEKDKCGQLNRPIARGLLDRRVALLYAIAFATAAVALEGLVNRFGSLGVLAATLVGVFVYSPLSKRIPVAKGVATAALTLTPIAYAGTVLGQEVPAFIYVATAIFIIGREVLLDIKDFQRDLDFGLKTVVAYLGIVRSRLLAWTLMFAGIVYLIAQMHVILGTLLAMAGLISLTVACLLDRHNEVRDAGLTKLAMALCILAIPFGM